MKPKMAVMWTKEPLSSPRNNAGSVAILSAILQQKLVFFPDYTKLMVYRMT